MGEFLGRLRLGAGERGASPLLKVSSRTLQRSGGAGHGGAGLYVWRMRGVRVALQPRLGKAYSTALGKGQKVGARARFVCPPIDVFLGFANGRRDVKWGGYITPPYI